MCPRESRHRQCQSLAIPQRRFTNYTRFTSIHITDCSWNRDFLLHDSMESSTLRMLWGVYRSGYGSLTRLYTAEFKIVEQRSQIVLQLRMGSIIIPPPKVLKWLAGTIRYYYCQLSPLAPDWTTESDRCEEWEPSAPTLFYFVKQVNGSWLPMSEYRCAHIMPYKDCFLKCSGDDYNL